jgi:hypothetical protein
MINIHTEPRTKRRSEKLLPNEIKALKKMVSAFPVVVAAAEYIGISRHVLDAVLHRGSGSPETIATIREKLGGS